MGFENDEEALRIIRMAAKMDSNGGYFNILNRMDAVSEATRLFLANEKISLEDN